MALNPNSDLGQAITAAISAAGGGSSSATLASEAQMQNVIAETFDALLCASAGNAYSTGVLHLIKLVVPISTTITNLLYTVGTAGATLTSGQNLMGLYNAAGTLLGQTADQSTTFAGTANISTGKAAALSSPVAVTAGNYFIGVLTNGTTGVAFGRATNLGPYQMYTSATNGGHRYASVGTGYTALPSTFTPANVVVENVPVWAGVA